jgi:hypothetical protein
MRIVVSDQSGVEPSALVAALPAASRWRRITRRHGELPDRQETSSPDREFQKRETSELVWRVDRLPFDQRAVSCCARSKA